MSEALERVVFDCNVFAAGLINPSGSAGECIERVLGGELMLFWSDFVIAEIRRIPGKETPKRLGVTEEKVESECFLFVTGWTILPLCITILSTRKTPIMWI